MTGHLGVGQSFGRYRLGRRLGHGGMGVVHAALDTTLNREVALKLVAPHLAADPDFRARFAREAEVMAQLDSPRAVRIHDHGEQDGTLYIVTQLIDGGDLGALMRESGALAPALAVEVVGQVVEGLGDAHAAGITHRDIKPANVLVRQRAGEVEAFLCDFGIATTAGSALTSTGTVAGSLPYMAPERHRAEDAGPAGDLYSAGCLLWFALVGAAPYAGTDVEVAFGHLQGPVPQLPGKDEFSKRANAVLAKAMAKDPRKRYAGARAMREDLRALAALAPGSIALPGATAIRQAVVLPAPRRGRSALLAVLAVLAVVGGTLGGRAWLAEPGAAAGSTTTTEVTQTVRGPHGRNLEPRHTLVPAPSASRQVQQGEPVVAPQEPGLAPPPGGTSVATAAPEPAPVRYRCWDRTRIVTRLADCGVPTGLNGFRWLYPKLSGQPCIEPWGSTGGNLVEGWRCSYQTPYGSVGVSILRHTTVTASYDQHTNWFAATVPWTTWSQNGAVLGHRKDGPSRANADYYGTGLHYRQIPWGIGISNTSGSRAAVQWFEKNVVGTVRPAGQVLGVRL